MGVSIKATVDDQHPILSILLLIFYIQYFTYRRLTNLDFRDISNIYSSFHRYFSLVFEFINNKYGCLRSKKSPF